MKKLLILFLLLLAQIMTGCKTTEIKTVYVLPPKPQRKELQNPHTIPEYAQIVNYYEHLVQEWEIWSNTVSNMVEADLH